MAPAMPADSSENLQLSQRTDGREPALIARDHSVQSTKGMSSRRGACDTIDRINQFPNQPTRINGFWLKKMYFWTYLPWVLKSTIFEEHN